MSQEHLSSLNTSWRHGNNKLLMVAMIAAVLLSFLAVIIAMVTIGRTSSTMEATGSNPSGGVSG